MSYYHGTLSALKSLHALRDPYTRGHQDRVGILGETIALEMGLDVDMAILIRQSGEVHDIGKVAVPSDILNAPRRLNNEELTVMAAHPENGAEVLRTAKLPWPIPEVAMQHHERLDGSGYPLHLPAEKIILPARIIAVADVVEAMSNHRPYRSGLGIEAALSEVKSGAGSLYDTKVVEATLVAFERGFAFQVTLGQLHP